MWKGSGCDENTDTAKQAAVGAPPAVFLRRADAASRLAPNLWLMQALGYIAIFVASALLSLFLTPLAMRFALRRRLVDEPGPNKSHSSPVPYLGGTAIVASFVVAVALAALARGSRNGLVEILIVLALGLVVSGIGLMDDLRPFSPVLRLAIETAVAAGLWLADVRIVMFGSDMVGFIVTLLWVVGLINAQNFIDGRRRAVGGGRRDRRRMVPGDRRRQRAISGRGARGGARRLCRRVPASQLPAGPDLHG